MEIFICRIDTPVDEKDFKYLLQFSDCCRQKKILNQKSKPKADCMLIGETLAKAAIRQTFGIPVKHQHIIHGNGKPYLKDFPNVHFNISHSGKYAVCAVSDTPIGVDIQKIYGGYTPALFSRVCTESEIAQIEHSPDPSAEFIRLWTQKEAVVKMYGSGISRGDFKNCIKNENIVTYRLEDYFLSVCSKK